MNAVNDVTPPFHRHGDGLLDRRLRVGAHRQIARRDTFCGGTQSVGVIATKPDKVHAPRLSENVKRRPADAQKTDKVVFRPHVPLIESRCIVARQRERLLEYWQSGRRRRGTRVALGQDSVGVHSA